MAKNYDKHTGEGRLLDEEFCRIAIQTGYWKRLSEGGPDAIMRMPVEQVPEKRATRKTKAFEREQQELIPSTSGAPKKGSFAISEFSAEESSAKASEDPPTRLSVASRLAGAVRNASLPLITDQDARNEAIAENHDAYVMLVVGLTVLVGWPLWISVSSPAMVSMVTVLLYSALLRWHFRRFPLFWNALLVRSVVAASTMTSPPQSAAVPRVTMMREQLHSLASNLQQTAVQEPDFDAPMTSMEHSTPIITQTSASPSLPSKAPHVQNTTLRRRPQTSNGATKPSPRISPERATTLTDDNNVVGDARRNSSASDVEFDRDDDLDSSDGEHDDSLPMQQQLQDEDDDDDDVELDEEEMRVFNDPEDDDAVSRFFANVSNEVDTELGDISTISLRDIRVKAPVFVDRSIFGSDQQIVYILQITFPNRVKRTVERLYTDFVRLQKHLALTVPQCKVRMKTTYLPKKRLSNQTSIGIVLDQRRSVVETYMRELLADEVIAKLGHRVLMEFLRQRGVLFAPPSAGLVANARKRLFLSSPSAASTVSDTANNNANVKNVIMMKFRWRTCLRETRIALDRVGGTLQLYCQFPPLKEVHCSIPVDEIEDVLHLNDLPDAAQRLPFIGDKYHFMEVRTSHKESFYFCAAREVVVEWMQDILSLRQQFRTEPPRSPYKNSASMSASARSFSNPYRCKRPTLESSNSDNRIILNRRRLMLGKAAISKRHPCVVISELLELILGIFQEYTDSKCVFLPKIAQRLLTFAEQSTELQVVDLAKLETHAERLAFHLNLYHTMIIHSHLELGFGPSPSSSKRLKMIFRTICYDVHNQIFSSMREVSHEVWAIRVHMHTRHRLLVQDIEHSMLRAKMSRPATMTNTIFAQLLSPRLNRRDPRNEWALTQPDLRINFVVGLREVALASLLSLACLSTHDPANSSTLAQNRASTMCGHSPATKPRSAISLIMRPLIFSMNKS